MRSFSRRLQVRCCRHPAGDALIAQRESRMARPPSLFTPRSARADEYMHAHPADDILSMGRCRGMRSAKIGPRFRFEKLMCGSRADGWDVFELSSLKIRLAAGRRRRALRCYLPDNEALLEIGGIPVRHPAHDTAARAIRQTRAASVTKRGRDPDSGARARARACGNPPRTGPPCRRVNSRFPRFAG